VLIVDFGMKACLNQNIIRNVNTIQLGLIVDFGMFSCRNQNVIRNVFFFFFFFLIN
jgi:uncharacterized radical SAM superfamily Fe-S cluster-containing enzyme